MIDDRQLDTKIELDGRVSMENIENYGKELADIFVTGSTCLKKDDLDGSLEQLMAFRNSLIK